MEQSDWFSFTNYIKIVNIDIDKCTVEDEEGEQEEVSLDQLSLFNSCSNYNKVMYVDVQ